MISNLLSKLLDWIGPVVGFLFGWKAKGEDALRKENKTLREQISNDVHSVADADRVWNNGSLPGSDTDE